MKKYRSYILIILLVPLTAKVLLPQLDSLAECMRALKDADLAWILLGILVYFSGVPILAVQFTALMLKAGVYILTNGALCGIMRYEWSEIETSLIALPTAH